MELGAPTDRHWDWDLPRQREERPLQGGGAELGSSHTDLGWPWGLWMLLLSSEGGQRGPPKQGSSTRLCRSRTHREHPKIPTEAVANSSSGGSNPGAAQDVAPVRGVLEKQI